MRRALTFFLILALYAMLSVAAILGLPLRLQEILQAGAVLHFSWHGFFTWIAQAPGGAPFGFLMQLPFALIDNSSRLLLRVPSLIFGLGSALLFFTVAQRLQIKHPLLALVLFLAAPVHLAYATQGRPFEVGLFLMLLATIWFFGLTQNPSIGKAIGYWLALTLCLYTQPSSALPAIGYTLYLLGFANVPGYRRAIWFSLGAAVAALLAYVPYFAWAGPQRKETLAEQFPSYVFPVTPLQAALSLDPGNGVPWFGLALMGVLLFGLAGAIWMSIPRPAYGPAETSAPAIRMRVLVFCLSGGAMVAILCETALCAWTSAPFVPYMILWALPALILATCASLDAVGKIPLLQKMSLLGPALCAVMIFLCIPGDVDYFRSPSNDMASLTAAIRPELTGDSCLVFVSQKQSRYLFSVFDPDLSQMECRNFFHRRIVLAVHPYVRADQERDARLFFHGLDFTETRRRPLNGGAVIVMDSTK